MKCLYCNKNSKTEAHDDCKRIAEWLEQLRLGEPEREGYDDLGNGTYQKKSAKTY